jgi:hypothetical protein
MPGTAQRVEINLDIELDEAEKGLSNNPALNRAAAFRAVAAFVGE